MEGNDGDDGEANENLSFKVVEKALLMRGARLDQSENDAVVVSGDDVSKNGTGVVTVGGGDDVGYTQAVGLSSSPSIEAEAVTTVTSALKKKKKKKKTKKMEIEEKYVIVAREEERQETIKAPPEAVNASEELPESVDPNDVVISDNIVLRKLLRGPRYFDPPDSGWSTCYNCGEEGHMAVNCPSLQKKKKPCFVCGSLEHGAKECKKGRACFICLKGGHQAKDCPEKNKEKIKGARKCLKCGDSGHDMFSCQNSYPLDDLKEIQCYICKGIGHLSCTEFVDDGAIEVSCYKCGELGHYAMACSRLHKEANNTASPSSCFKCGEGGHFARECTSSVKAGKRKYELSTSKKNKNKLESKSALHNLDKDHKRKRSKPEERGITTAQKPKNRGRWTVEHPGHSSKLKSRSEELGLAMQQKSKRRGKKRSESEEQGLTMPQRSKRRGGWIMDNSGDSSKTRFRRGSWRSPSTPFYNDHEVSTTTAGYMLPNSPPSMIMHDSHVQTPLFSGSVTPFQQRYSASRLDNSGGRYGNSGGWHGSSSNWDDDSSSAGTRRFRQRYASSRFDDSGGRYDNSSSWNGNSGGWHGNSAGWHGNSAGWHGNSAGWYGNFRGGGGTRRGYDWR